MTSEFQISETFYGNLRNFVGKRVSEPADAEDILHDSLYKAQRNIHRIKDKTKMTSWIYQIVRRTIIDFYKLGYLSVVLDEAILTDQQESGDNYNKILAACLRAKLKQLPDKYRSALELTELESLKQVELSHQLGISKSGAKSRVQRGRKQLKDLLTQCCDIDTDKHGNVVDYEEKRPCPGSCGCQSKQ